MKKVNEKRRALVDGTGQMAAMSRDRDWLKTLVEQGQIDARLARVQITEIEEGEEDGKTI